MAFTESPPPIMVQTSEKALKSASVVAIAFVPSANLSNSKTEIEFSMGKLLVSIDENHNIKMMGPVSEIKEIKVKL